MGRVWPLVQAGVAVFLLMHSPVSVADPETRSFPEKASPRPKWDRPTIELPKDCDGRFVRLGKSTASRPLPGGYVAPKYWDAPSSKPAWGERQQGDYAPTLSPSQALAVRKPRPALVRIQPEETVPDGFVRNKEVQVREASFFSETFPDEFTVGDRTLVGRGYMTSAFQITLVDGERFVVLVPAPRESGYVDLEAVRLNYQVAEKFLKETEQSDPAALRFFPQLKAAYTGPESARERRRVPALVFEEATFGSAYSHLKDGKFFGPKASFRENLEALRQTAQAVEALHSRGYAHGDIKPGNFLITDRGAGPVYLLSDLMDVRKVGDPASLVWTNGFVQSPGSLRRRGADTAFQTTHFDRDTHALAVTAQEMLLGKNIGIEEIPSEHMGTDPGMFVPIQVVGSKQIMTLQLKQHSLLRSPHSINPHVNEMLSAISWIHFESASQKVAALNEAERIHALAEKAASPEEKQRLVDSFFSEYLGPQVLSKLSHEDAFLTISTANELRFRFKKNQLGLTAEQRSAIGAELLRLGNAGTLPFTSQEIPH